MKMQLSMVAGLVLLPLTAMAQRPEGPPERPFGPPPGGGFFGEMGRPGERAVVKGAPFKATATTESTQSLADGNTIVHKDRALTYRDAEGRTRREMALPARPDQEGPARTLVFVDDPVAGTGFVLESDTHTARQRPQFNAARAEGGGRPGGLAPGPQGPPAEDARFKPQESPLGTRTIEGLQATGTRSTVTIPAGAIGNTRPIQIVSERWYSAELKTVLLSTQRDPRFGVRTFRLSGIAAGDVDRSLFEVPAGYTVSAGPPGRGRGPGPGAPGGEDR